MLAVSPLPYTSFVYIFVNSVGYLFFLLMQNLWAWFGPICLFLPFFWAPEETKQKNIAKMDVKHIAYIFLKKSIFSGIPFKSLTHPEFLIALSTWIQNSLPLYPLRQWLSYFFEFYETYI